MRELSSYNIPLIDGRQATGTDCHLVKVWYISGSVISFSFVDETVIANERDFSVI